MCAVLAALALAIPLLGRAGEEARGNVLILVADDLGIDRLACYGAPAAPPTPTLDRLVADGVLFQNAWSQPTCSPTRATLQTGRYGFRTGVGSVINAFGDVPALSLDEVTLPEMLDLGTGGAYAHASIGKWHLGSSRVGGDLAPNLSGYAHFAGSLEGQLEFYDHWRRVVDGVATTSSRYATSACVDDALRWIRVQDRPWLCVVSFQAPHAPFHRPPPHLHTRKLPAEAPREVCGGPGADPEPFFAAAVEALDTEIGRLLAGIQPAVRARTTVFFLGDNGTDACVARPEFRNRAKGTLYESGLRVPLVVAGFSVADRGRSAALVSTSDLFATVAELAGVELAATLPGVALDSHSLVPCLADRRRSVRSWLYAEVFTPNGAGNPAPLPPCPPTEECQPSLGLDGPGDATLSACGPPLYGAYGANVVRWQLAGAPPRANAWLLIGPYAPAWEPRLGAMLVSPAPSYVRRFVTQPDGTLAGSTWTGSTSHERHYQLVLQDARAPRGFGVTNAVRMEPLWTDMRAVRRARYKLVRFDPCHEELFDLALDPLEATNLLARPLAAEEVAAYERLAAVLDGLR
jgi:arylsulfatase A-like enzyme